MRTREQERAKHAYESVARVGETALGDYKIVVNGFGATILRSGLCAALAYRDRLKTDAADLFLQHLAKGMEPRLGKIAPERLGDEIRNKPVAEYVLCTREALSVVQWLKRATQSRHGG